MIMVIGGKGNMGQRYCAILRHLGIKYSTIDIEDKDQLFKRDLADGFIVATPTKNHIKMIYDLAQYNKPILCEKPISTNVESLLPFLETMRRQDLNLQMVNQYAYMPLGDGEGFTEYNYFKHGGDGLAWDCLNILGLANGEVHLGDDSPIWRCTINGKKLSIADMDNAYINMVANWVGNPEDNIDYIEHAHRKVINLAMS